jgi:formate dehydrogenase maturation protein FdhE
MEVVAVASAAIMDTAEVLPTVVVAVVAEAKVTMTAVILSTVEEVEEVEGAMVQRVILELLGLAVAMAKVVMVATNMAVHLAQTVPSS